jgi:non-homologous end joining protein Ku
MHVGRQAESGFHLLFEGQIQRRQRRTQPFTADELEALDVESSKIIDLETFVPRAEVDPVYFSAPYYVYPDGPIAVETFGVIGAAMGEAGMVALAG